VPRDAIALIGHGAIAQAVLSAAPASTATRVVQVLVRPGKAKAVQPLLPEGCTAIESLSDLLPEIGFVLECAGHDAVQTFGPDCLARGIDFGVVSVGALADAQVHDALSGAAQSGGSRAVILPGAIGGIDALAAAGSALEEVQYTSRKPPQSWRGSPAEAAHNLAEISKPTVLFEGPARQAALDFRKNANVVATVALAGIGFEHTKVTLIADPAAQGNTHEITASGGGYAFQFSTSGASLPQNPRTSALTSQSALRAIAHRSAGITI